MKSVFVVELGEYSDRGIRAVFETEEKALKYFPAENINEWTLGMPEGECAVAYVAMHIDTGNKVGCEFHITESPVRKHTPYVNRNGIFHTRVETADKETAMKVANERRLMFKIRHPDLEKYHQDKADRVAEGRRLAEEKRKQNEMK